MLKIINLPTTAAAAAVAKFTQLPEPIERFKFKFRARAKKSL